MNNPLSRRKFLANAGTAAALAGWSDLFRGGPHNTDSFAITASDSPATSDRIVDMHVHFDEKNPNFINDFLKVSEKLNLTACVLTPFANRRVVLDAAKQHPTQIIPFGFVDLDAPDVVKQVEELHAMGYRGLGELEFVKKPYNDPSYFPVYELANRYGWIVLFHTGIVLRRKFDEPEDVASGRMRPIYLEEIARRFPKITVLGAHCGNPEYEWAAEIARWNPNVFWDLSGSTLTKMQARLADFQKIFWWSNTEWQSPEWKAKKQDSDTSAFGKIVFGSDNGLDGIEPVVKQYHALFEACAIPDHTRKMIMGGTLSKMLGLSNGH
ncbi:MAG TPA: amidohydrolase family protein [Candidatus Acidoferrum sp.]|nr:amidohydrolase family protein [Candidatus Acidoferrum sp.]